MNSAVEYCALSYCWGEQQQSSTTANNLEQRYLEFLLHELPATLQDGIEVAAHLGVEYVWIDSLCIVQASSKDGRENRDWANHVSIMGTIYANAYCTIIVSESEHSGNGFLRLGGYGSPRFRLPQRYAIPFSKHDPSGASEKYEIYDECKPLHVVGEIPPLEKRAWAMQESLLSSRRLVFSYHGLKFECGEKRASERLPRLINHREMDFEGQYMAHFQAIPGSILLRRAVEGSEGAWASLVNSYNSRSLSFWSDKLAAFERIARAYQRQTRGKEHFAAGIRKSRQVLDLCRVTGTKSYGMNNPEIPSWSWTSTQEGTILFPQMILQDPVESRVTWDLEIMDANWESPGTPQFSDHLLNRNVKFKGYMGEIGKIRGVSDGRAISEEASGSLGWWPRKEMFAECLVRPYEFFDDKWRSVDNKEPEMDEHHDCLWLGVRMQPVNPSVSISPSVYWALALQPVKSSKHTYSRIGLLAILDPVMYKDAQKRTVTLV